MPLVRLMLILGALTALGPLSIDMYLPSFPSMAKSFAVDPGRVQATLSIFFIGLAVGQAFYGPLADRYGRRRPLLIGVAIYITASAFAAFTPTIESLMALRLVQALGGCAGMVISRAVVRDLFNENEAARVFSMLILVMGLAPILAPLIGGYILVLAGWRAIFLILAGFGLMAFIASWAALDETLPAEARRRDSLAGVFRNYGRLMVNPRFIAPALASSLIMAGMFAYIANSPFVFIELHGVTPRQFGLLFGLNALGLVGASQINRAVLLRWSPRTILGWAIAAQVTAALILLSVAGSSSLPVFMVPLWFCIASLGFLNPNAVAIAMSASGRHAGSASALMGMMQFTAGALAGMVVGSIHNGTAYPMAITIAGFSLAGGFAYVLGREQEKRRR
ncbi:MAG: Bcr/CflA family multidrug efflux MFS transporter [Nitrospirae bacterium]|nr:Bcr/CflA family multidrug efflux MFS transporter [Nitrospirota bacterium]